ncbi:PREDICTED: uncharacterized protein LOC106805983 [Priapulus caudatus]|uniref:Uncharacterized protein LOC106805983 n=1 Tax=Priapulus caudatus TaxID=37621 RepID=A0ABM1DTL0_PRICU|nr:PREDICTED: uncharacterized protein LOC106805983 [Priapulus caudatus]
MSSETTDARRHLASVVTATAASMEEILATARLRAAGSVEEFLERDYGCMGRALGVYRDMLAGVGCATRRQAEDAWGRCYANRDVRESVDDLLEVEGAWNAFLHDVDDRARRRSNDGGGDGGGGGVEVGDPAPGDARLRDAGTRAEVALADYLGGAAVVVVLLRHFA